MVRGRRTTTSRGTWRVYRVGKKPVPRSSFGPCPLRGTRGTRGTHSTRNRSVVVKHRRHALVRIGEVGGERVQRRGELDRLSGGEVVGRVAGALQDDDLGDPAVALDREADGDHAA